jgi:hypothetical protein
MGFSATPLVIIGVEASKIVDFVAKEESFEKFDERGNKTGGIGKEMKYTLSATVDGKKVSETDNRLYSDSVCSLLDLPELYSDSKKELGVFSVNNYDGKKDIDDDVIGVIVLSVDVMTNETVSSEESDISSLLTIVRQKIKNKFGVDVAPKLFLNGNGSC